MASLDSFSIAILLGAVLVMAGILSSLVALRFGAPLLLVFLGLGIVAGEAGPGGLAFNDVGTTYLVGSVALALILFDGGLKTKFQNIKTVLAPSIMLATFGVLLTALITAPVAHYALGVSWTEALLVGAVVASTDAAAVFLLVHAQGLRLRPRVGATLEAESGTNDPFAVFLTLMLVEILSVGHSSAGQVALEFIKEAVLGAAVGFAGGRLVVFGLNRVALPQGLHAPFVTTAALVIFGLAQIFHASGFLAVYLAGIVIGNRPTRAHNSVVVFLDAATWLAQIVMFVLLGLLASPQRLVVSVVPAIAVAAVLMLVARPVAVFVCLAPFRFNWREKLFMAWVGLRGAVAIFLASIPLLIGMPKAYLYFDVAFVIVVISLLLQGWTLGAAARRLHVALPRTDRAPRRVELDLPGQLEQQLVGYSVRPNSLYLRRGIIPSWSKPTLVIRKEKILSPVESGPVKAGDYLYLLAPPEKAQSLDRFFSDMAPTVAPDPHLLGDFMVSGEITLGALSEIYGVQVAPDEAALSLADYFDVHLDHAPKAGATLPLDSIVLVARNISGNRVNVVGLRLPEDEEAPAPPPTRAVAVKTALRRAWASLVES
ncbi:potassium/proton antiporter [Bradyrhizobium sp. U87765 SZCCT0131]|uniref:potassium/proton antiporter n=1 Tax=unclassified Bradyrhizobium TaxID=2631580 RepID=UPI001BAB545D|nr:MULTISPECIES: potassium/proton antiporter [unclassified Bradyrhizobium]MBR1217335.1 potassium/proton antiporter [Bradyrhizobium sp. U87765 SZCCT0131]MBR1265068.1 potassium/proton antiporter [Bradyrhizobium sp. U87765 SZCCT0134]MBR1305050.1 potassium/proton antiporter [Bradyrhizobium sp. U87765 SZCCT0110]MBR1320836.1 potassium/proton antiporter [Bradyrhizobium sp. U87765 SZCCT0109]MBR1349256.1 potassium/proton antiporter [Bradyrhizobium sp. U87765 SZCCT0048]